MECNFFVGQKVVCVDAAQLSAGAVMVFGRIHPEPASKCELVYGAIYEIACIRIAPETGATVFDIVGRQRAAGLGYRPDRFRPVTDISDLKKIVAEVFTKKPQKVAA